jgi:uncharacterized lipoprotein NlpE involved in copper resistance
MKKIILFLSLCLTCLCLVGCENQHDNIEIYNKTDWIFDNIEIKIKDGYFYNSHDKFTVDENTVGVTIYFSNNIEDIWD